MIAGVFSQQKGKPEVVAMRNRTRSNMRLMGRQVFKGMLGRVKTRVVALPISGLGT